MDKKTRLSLLFVSLLWMIAQYAYVPILSSFANELGANAFMVGLIGGAYGTVSLCLRLPLSILSDKINRKKIFIVLGVIFALIGALLPCFIQTPLSLLIGRCLAGICIATWVHFTVLFASYYPKEKKGFALGLINALAAGGQCVGTVLCAFLAARFGNISPYWAAVIIALIALPIAVFRVKESRDQDATPLSLKQIVSVIKVKYVFFFSIISAAALFLFFATAFSFTPLIAEKLFAANKAQLSILSSIALFCSFASSIVVSYIPYHANSRLICWVSCAIMAVSTALIPFSPSMMFLYTMQGINGFFTNFLNVYLNVLLLKYVSPRQLTAATGFFQTIYSLGIAFGPIITGMIQTATNNYGVTYLLISSMAVVSMVAFWLHYHPDKFKHLEYQG